jgi:arylsulfatase A-like enzyme
VQPPPYLSGVSLVPALVDPKAIPRNSAITGGRGSYTIRTARYRYTRRGRGPGNAANSELYDHQSDPEEMVNLIRDPSQSDVVTYLSALLDERAHDAGIPPEGVIQNTFEFERVTPDQFRKKK